MCILPIKVGDKTYYMEMEEWEKMQEWRKRRESNFPKLDRT
jgi:hypothetical protein